MLKRALDTFKRTKDRPTLIIVDSHIAYGAPTLQGSHKAHGSPLGEAEIEGAKQFYGLPPKEKFHVPDGVYEDFKQNLGRRGGEARAAWMSKFEQYKSKFPELADQLYRMQHRQLPEAWEKSLPTFPPDAKGSAGLVGLFVKPQ